MEKTYDIFFSYSRQDYLMDDEKTPDPDKIVSKILNVLDTHNISYWIDKEGLFSSAQFAAVIEEQIAAARCFLFVSTQASNASKYTLGEVFTAVEYEKPIIPFRADDSKFGKGIGFHLRPLDHIEYFKTGEEAFVKLVTSINHIKAEQLYDQLVTEYKNIVAEYKEKLRAKSDEMKQLGINPPVDCLTDDEAIQKIKKEYEQKIVKYQDEIRKLERKISELASSLAKIQDVAANAQKEMEDEIHVLRKKTSSYVGEIDKLNNELSKKQQEVVSLKQNLSETTSTLDKVKRELQAYKDTETERKAKEERERKAFEVEALRKAEEEKKREIFRIGNVKFKMIHVEGGTFTMGEGSEAHQVKLSSFYIGETPVTQALWKEITGKSPSYFEGEQKPVESVSWNDCQDFIMKLNDKTGKKFRLLTEAEWEFAARGGNKTKNYEYAGSNNIDEVAWYRENSYRKGWSSPDYGTHPVKTKMPNELGIYDMTGNVCEWCQDRNDSYSKNSQTNPIGPAIEANRVGRGGSWYNDAGFCRSSYRNFIAPDFWNNNLGFRLALSE